MIHSILYVWLPCKKVYPVGLAYLAQTVHDVHPGVRQRILDLSIISRSERSSALREEIRTFQPDLLLFSWRDIQIFAPHDGDPTLKYAFTMDYSRNPIKRLVASLKGLRSFISYHQGIRECLSYPWQVSSQFSQLPMMIGGGAFGVFSDQLIRMLPEGMIGILGEGEEAVLKRIEGRDLGEERYILRRDDQILQGEKSGLREISSLMMDLPYLETVFPQHASYHDECIGIQTKRGCPYDCQFCEYPYIEGKRVRYRPPEKILADILQHNERWGTRRFWFTDAQFITGKQALPHCTEILERIIASRIKIEWSGYIRTSLITAPLARLMVQSGVGDLEVAITSGSQEVLNELHMGFKLDHLYEGCRYLKEAGFSGRLLLNYSLNSPGDTEETLRESVESYKRIAGILGEDRVFPMLFFLGIQPHTGLENRLISEGYLSSGYNPLSMNPFLIKKLLYNPAPLSRRIAKACLSAWGITARKKSAETGLPVKTVYADRSLFQGVVEDSGRQTFIQLEELLKK
jgi:radical SAM superfamily enzyme YgiQ (UPF0313 family)